MEPVKYGAKEMKHIAEYYFITVNYKNGNSRLEKPWKEIRKKTTVKEKAFYKQHTWNVSHKITRTLVTALYKSDWKLNLKD